MPASSVLWSRVAALLALERFGLGRWKQPAAPPYCKQPGTPWSGLTPLPSGLPPECSGSQSRQREVRSGQSQAELYQLKGSSPQVLLHRQGV
ncbi:hypothetical protein SAMN00790413_04170 [Deinococcus hopiensis KR-140]|uniref:Uncharacterized protein n=1 Tax=Deinococcus hopiensis KR-140 TaxID=695939 RepID=A0A1W1UP09_9DEIO|nr:hypothetical protein SAMN00790413_04170 [Deinococcus hopiensis KR-140]